MKFLYFLYLCLVALACASFVQADKRKTCTHEICMAACKDAAKPLPGIEGGKYCDIDGSCKCT